MYLKSNRSLGEANENIKKYVNKGYLLYYLISTAEPGFRLTFNYYLFEIYTKRYR